MSNFPDIQDPTQTSAWKQLSVHADEMASRPLSELLADTERNASAVAELPGLYLDLTRCRANERTFELLLALADECGALSWLQAQVDGEVVNTTEQRKALHSSLRGGSGAEAAEAAAEQERLLAFADAIRAEGRFNKVVNIGIGGSDFGPRLLCAALADEAPEGSPDIAFVAGVDGIELRDALRDAEPERTLFIVCSKTFTTLETRENADAAKAWLLQSVPAGQLGEHFAAVTANVPAVGDFGIQPERCFPMWDWVGGRFSLWSAVGLAAAIRLGSDAYREFLAGGAAMDEHVREAAPGDNLALRLALLSVWNRNFLKLQHEVVLAYDQRLGQLPDYLQQLFMESLGKLVRHDGATADYATGAALWGSPGSHAQHSFAQWLHQGSGGAHIGFVGTAIGPDVLSANAHAHSLSNLLAQADALAYGRPLAEVDAELSDAEKSAGLVPHKVHPGNRSSHVILLRELTPHALGMLIALYEYQVTLQAAVWGINPFDQWGVELGKQRARRYAGALVDGAAAGSDELPLLAQRIQEWRR